MAAGAWNALATRRVARSRKVHSRSGEDVDGLDIECLILDRNYRGRRRICASCNHPPLAILSGQKHLPAVPQ